MNQGIHNNLSGNLYNNTTRNNPRQSLIYTESIEAALLSIYRFGFFWQLWSFSCADCTFFENYW